MTGSLKHRHRGFANGLLCKGPVSKHLGYRTFADCRPMQCQCVKEGGIDIHSVSMEGGISLLEKPETVIMC